MCNEQGFLTVAVEFTVKASIQPATIGYNRPGQRSNELLGDVQRDDKIGFFPCAWSGHTLDFRNWSDAGEDYVVYDSERYIVVAADKLADIDGVPDHHWEVGLRLVRTSRAT